jgi:hypothetical protein
MPYHHSNVKRLALVLILGGCFLWTKRDLVEQWLPANSSNTNALVDFGPSPIIPVVPSVPDFQQQEELLLQQQELIEQQLELREKLMNELKEKTDRIKIN